MSLPEVKVNFFTENLLSNPSKEVRYRPYNTKEEKDFLLAVETEEEEKITDAIEAIVRNCVQGADIDNEMTPVDTNFLLVRIRQKGKGTNIAYAWKCDACKGLNRDILDTDADLEFKPADSTPITVGKWQINIKWPTNALIGKLKKFSDIDRNYKVLAYSIKSIVEGETVSDEFTPDEIEEWLEKLPPNLFEEYTISYGEKSPRIIVNKKVKCSHCDAEERDLELEEAAAFFLS